MCNKDYEEDKEAIAFKNYIINNYVNKYFSIEYNSGKLLQERLIDKKIQERELKLFMELNELKEIKHFHKLNDKNEIYQICKNYIYGG